MPIIISFANSYPYPNEFLYDCYRTNKDVMSFMALYKGVTETLDIHFLPEFVSDHLFNLSALYTAEVIQMHMDITRYDLHYQKIEFTPLDRNLTGFKDGFVKTKFVVKGLSESRPKISIGDIVRIRPALEDLNNLSAQDGIQRFVVEFQGIIIACSLQSEEVTCQFLISHEWVPTSYPISMHKKMDDLNKLSFHVRFTFKREGFAIIAESLNRVIKNPSLAVPTLASCNDFMSYSKLKSCNSLESNKLNELLSEGDREWNKEQLFAINAISAHIWKDCLLLNSSSNRCSFGNSASNYGDDFAMQLPPFIIHGPPGTGACSLI